jgi:hypothetical protein
MEYDIQDKTVANIFHVTTTDPIDAAKLNDFALIFRDWWIVDQAQAHSHDIGLHTVVALDVSVPNGAKVELPVSPPELGLVTSPAPSNNVAFVVSLKTDKTGRSFQGRTYLAGLPLDAITDNEISIAKTANIVTSFNALITQLQLNASELVIASYINGGVPRVTAVGTVVTSIAMDRRVDTQRRRLPR